MQKEDILILVDEDDKPTGKLGKLKVHQSGLLHRAFSIFIFNTKGELLMQQRADGKYHSGGLWSNTCCSHPQFGENIEDAVKRRLFEEMGIISHSVQPVFTFRYKTHFDGGLTENELDHVYFGVTDSLPNPDYNEIKDWKYVDMYNLKLQLLLYPELYTKWLKICFDKVLHHFEKLIAS